MKKIEIPIIAGIYIIHVLDDDVWYIGESQNIYYRFLIHSTTTFTKKIIDFFILEEMKTSSKSQRLDAELKQHYKPHDKKYGQLPLAKRFNVGTSTIGGIVKTRIYKES